MYTVLFFYFITLIIFECIFFKILFRNRNNINCSILFLARKEHYITILINFIPKTLSKLVKNISNLYLIVQLVLFNFNIFYIKV